jgi:glycosyltransferase involved in cell wall biosynthesis
MKICMVAYAFYETDTRIVRYAESLAERGNHVDMLALYRPGQVKYELINGVHVHRIQERVVNESGKLDFLYRILKFLLLSFFILSVRHLRHKYDLVHVHSVPDFEVFAALIPKLSGAAIILDIHDIVPEFYASKFNVPRDSLVFRLLVLAEKISIAFSDHVIIANDLWKQTLIGRGISPDKLTAMINDPDITVFHPRERLRDDNRFVLIYPGTLNYHQGVDIAVRAAAIVQQHIPQLEMRIYGEGNAREELLELVQNLGLEGHFKISSWLPMNDIAQEMADADIGIVPKRADSFGDEAFSTKILEFMAVGIPVIVSDTRIDRHYFNDSLVRFFSSGDEQALAEAIELLWRDKQLRQSLVENSREFVAHNNWNVRKHDYLALVDRLVGYHAD